MKNFVQLREELQKPKPMPPKKMDNLKVIQHIVATESECEQIEFNDGSSVKLDNETANKIIACYARLAPENKTKLKDAINDSARTFARVAKFCCKNQV